jgi:hypothetical protein
MLFPENPIVNQEHTDPTNGVTYIYGADTVWSLKAPDINDAVVSSQAIPADGFTDGKRWVDPDDAISSVRITDAGGKEVWVEDGLGLIPSAWTTWVTAPTAASDPGVLGNVAHDASYFYIYTPASTWIRVAKDGTFV